MLLEMFISCLANQDHPLMIMVLINELMQLSVILAVWVGYSATAISLIPKTLKNESCHAANFVSSLVAPEVVIMTKFTSGTTSDDNAASCNSDFSVIKIQRFHNKKFHSPDEDTLLRCRFTVIRNITLLLCRSGGLNIVVFCQWDFLSWWWDDISI